MAPEGAPEGRLQWGRTRRYLAPLHITVAYIQHHARIFLFRRRHAASVIQRRARRSAVARLKRKHNELRRRLEGTKQKFATKMPQLTHGPHVTNNIAMLLFPIMVPIHPIFTRLA